MRNENFIYLRKGVRRIEIVTMHFSQEPEKKNIVTLSFFFQDYFISSYLPPQMLCRCFCGRAHAAALDVHSTDAWELTQPAPDHFCFDFVAD